MTVTQKKSRSQNSKRSTKSSKKAVSPQISVKAIESSQMENEKNSSEWNSESDTLMDLQAYYLLAADLLGKIQVDHANDESLSQITSRLWEEWNECYKHDVVTQQTSRSLITRLNLIKGLKLLYSMKPFIDADSKSSLKKVANLSKDLLDLLSDKFAEGKFMNSSMCINILVELKCLVHSLILIA
jgi:hypothetical protein